MLFHVVPIRATRHVRRQRTPRSFHEEERNRSRRATSCSFSIDSFVCRLTKHVELVLIGLLREKMVMATGVSLTGVKLPPAA